MLFLFIADGVPVRDKEDVVVYVPSIHDNPEFSYSVNSSQTYSRWSADSVLYLSFPFTCI